MISNKRLRKWRQEALLLDTDSLSITLTTGDYRTLTAARVDSLCKTARTLRDRVLVLTQELQDINLLEAARR